ncbi:uncharacterized protein [Battus philenor]|uniref:uncharacterized protein n=1 Tax=Battus philenor TaxID=42288 RepID=UPI0035D0DE48
MLPECRYRNKCVAPPYPANGRYIGVRNTDIRPGQSLPYALLNFSCNNGYDISGAGTLYCYEGSWSDTLPSCIKRCKLPVQSAVNYDCLSSDDTDGTRPCQEYEPSGTVVIPSCRGPQYQAQGKLPNMKCVDGVWNYVAVCKPGCGRDEESEMPWFAAVYSNHVDGSYQFVCGGAVVSKRIIISSASCFWSKSRTVASSSNFVVLVGKRHLVFDDPDNTYVQKSKVNRISVPNQFKGPETSYGQDLAVLHLTSILEYTSRVQPLCVDFDRLMPTATQISSRVKAVMEVPDNKPSQTFVTVELPRVGFRECIKLAANASKTANSDKICSIYGNKKKMKITGGMDFSDTSDGDQRYYLRGVVSQWPGSSAEGIYVFTDISENRQFIEDNLNWKCNDGSWIDRDKTCDGNIDCLDGSDEDDKLCKSSPVKENICVLPEYPENGKYTAGKNLDVMPGEKYSNVYINVTCDTGYRVNGESGLFCFEGYWSKEMPKCIRYCRLKQHPSVTYQCIKEDSGTNVCDEYVPPGTVVKPECRAPNYYHTGILSFMHCVNGTWDYIAVCRPECGTITPKGEELIANAASAYRGEVPWFVGIYKKSSNPYQLFCGGSIISPTAVITAAHCVWDDAFGRVNPASDYAVAAGKQYQPWASPLDEEFAQKIDVSAIATPARFQGSASRLQSDIAVLTLSKYFIFNIYVRPVCVDFNFAFNKQQLREYSYGMIAGWGWTESDRSSEILRIVEMPYIRVSDCLSLLPKMFRAFITSDKICAGYTNGTAACRGDSGSGLAFPETDRGVSRYYLRGVLSVAPSNSTNCNLNSPAGYTEIIRHQDFIEENLVESKQSSDESFVNGVVSNINKKCPDGSDETCKETNTNTSQETGRCVLPDYPKEGTYEVEQLESASPGTLLSRFTLTVTCSPGYSPSGNATVDCVEGVWSSAMPQCQRVCVLKPSPGVSYRCPKENSSGEELGSCNAVQTSGSVVKPSCLAPYYYSPVILPLMRCIEGSWDYVATCSPECGLMPSGNDIIITGDSKTPSSPPWTATIYTKRFKPYKQVCSGSIVSPTTVLAAAHCFWSDIEKKLPASDYAVAAGKLYKPWDHPRDTQAQKRDVKTIHIPPRFQGGAANFAEDIAVMIVSSPFEFASNVAPVCLDFDLNFNRHQLEHGNLGTMGGWRVLENGNKSLPIRASKVNIPYISIVTCISQSPPEFREYITSDKICAGYQNGTLLCRGDGGEGLAFPEPDRNKIRYYLRGILSTAPTAQTDLECDLYNFITFTEIIKHEDFIKENIKVTPLSNMDEENEIDKCVDGKQFKCTSGDCIELTLTCNGVKNCPDGSDESKSLCGSHLNDRVHETTKKPRTTTTTTESPTTTTTKRTTTTTKRTTTTTKRTTTTTTKPSFNYFEHGNEEITSHAKCILPGQPENGVYHVAGGKVENGEASLVFLDYSCYPRFAIVGNPKVFCWKGEWSVEKQPRCLQTCYLDRHESLDYNCIVEGTETTRICEDHEVEGTVIQPKCKEPNYYTPLELPYMVCKGGKWNVYPTCVPECGTLTPKGAPLVLGGEVAKFGDVPWHAGIYYKNKINGTHDQICGGSLISNSVVVSAAHCFWDEKRKRLHDVKNYAVAVGKLYRDWEHPGDEQYAQKSDVKEIAISKYYYGRELNYRDDIAVVVVSGPFQYQTYVRPVCLDFRQDFAENQLISGNMGKAAGWGLTTGLKGSESPELKVIDLPYVSYVECVQQTQPAFKQYITHDKICAGDTEGLLLCRGDSGGGLTFPTLVDNTLRFYLRGVASTSPPSNDNNLCNTHALTGFTAISKYQHLIKTYWLT